MRIWLIESYIYLSSLLNALSLEPLSPPPSWFALAALYWPFHYALTRCSMSVLEIIQLINDCSSYLNHAEQHSNPQMMYEIAVEHKAFSSGFYFSIVAVVYWSKWMFSAKSRHKININLQEIIWCVIVTHAEYDIGMMSSMTHSVFCLHDCSFVLCKSNRCCVTHEYFVQIWRKSARKNKKK